MLNRFAKVCGAIVLAGFVLPAAANAQMGEMHKPAGREATVRGTVIDLDCKFRNGLSGDQHRMCAQVCADGGLPLAILGNDGQLYMPVGGGMPGDPQNPRLKEFAEQEVVIHGNVYEAGGAKALEIKSVSRA